jgi:hypothetical protein
MAQPQFVFDRFGNVLRRELAGLGDTALTMGKNMVMQPAAGYAGLLDLARGNGLDSAVNTIDDTQSLAGGPQTAEGARNLQAVGDTMGLLTAPLTRGVDAVGEYSPLAGAALAGAGAAFDPSKLGRLAAAGKSIAKSKGVLKSIAGVEPDMVRSMVSGKAETIPAADVVSAINARANYRAEPPTTPGAKASEADWADWGARHGVNMTLTPSQSLGISDLTTRKEITLPGGLEGSFTIPDLFAIKGNNFDPNALPKDVHDALMQKFIRTHKVDSPDSVDTFNRLNFALLSPNAPLTQNEFLAQRARLTNPTELQALAGRVGEPGLAQTADAQLGVGAASRGGMGVKGTANLGNQAQLAAVILSHPDMFKIANGETMRDVTTRVMNQVPGLGMKTGSLATPWLDLPQANVSAVDLHMIRNNYERLLSDPDLGDAFRKRMGGLLQVEPTAEAIMSSPKSEKAAINVIGGNNVTRKYRVNGELNNIPASATPDKLAYEPATFSDFGPFYNKVVDYIDESRGPNPELALFPEQWRKWDGFRGRVEPHEFAHPDFRKLPRQSFSEMQAALQAHKDAGYMGTKKVMKPADWRKLYYGSIDPGLAAGVGGGLLGAAMLNDNQQGD